LYAGAPLISRVNNEELDLYNNETFIIKEIQHSIQNVLLVDESNEKRMLNIPFDRFQRLFYVAYCITIHKSQGTTFDFPYTIHEWAKYTNEMKYVALSRCTKKEQITIK
jgi:ATP-dependent exoDNAse (exonuclease V) alpha subunit